MEFPFREGEGVRWLTSSLLEATGGPLHGFGVRRAPGAPTPEPAELLGAFDHSEVSPLALRQVHGTAVVWAEAGREFPAQGDAVVSRDPERAPMVSTADCLPILLWDPGTGTVGAVHAGWRGLAAGIIETAVEAMEESGDPAERFFAAVGPAIGPCCYEVGDEVASEFEDDLLRPGFSDRPHLDLWEGARRRLLATGIPDNHTALARLCTACNPDWFASYRRDGSAAGRQVAMILPPRRC